MENMKKIVYVYEMDSINFAEFRTDICADGYTIEKRIARAIKVLNKISVSNDYRAGMTLNQICDNHELFFGNSSMFDTVKNLIGEGKVFVSTYGKFDDIIKYSENSLIKTLNRMIDGRIDPDEMYVSSLFPMLGIFASTGTENSDRICLLLGKSYRTLRYIPQNKSYIFDGKTITKKDLFIKSLALKNDKLQLKFGYWTIAYLAVFLLKKVNEGEFDLNLYVSCHTSSEKNSGAIFPREMGKAINKFLTKLVTIKTGTSGNLKLSSVRDVQNFLKDIIESSAFAPNTYSDKTVKEYLSKDKVKNYIDRLFTLHGMLTEKCGYSENSNAFNAFNDKYSKSMQTIEQLIRKNTSAYQLYCMKNFEGYSKKRKKDHIDSIMDQLATQADYGTRSKAVACLGEIIRTEIPGIADGPYSRMRQSFALYINYCYNIFNALLVHVDDNNTTIIMKLADNDEDIQLLTYQLSERGLIII